MFTTFTKFHAQEENKYATRVFFKISQVLKAQLLPNPVKLMEQRREKLEKQGKEEKGEVTRAGEEMRASLSLISHGGLLPFF